MTRRKRRKQKDPAWQVLGIAYIALAVVLAAYFILPLFQREEGSVLAATVEPAVTATGQEEVTATDPTAEVETPDVEILDTPVAAPDVITRDQLIDREPDRWGRVFSSRGVAYDAETLQRLPVLALTFDDGPHGTLTDDLIEVLAEYDVHATFFTLGENIEANPNTSRSLATHGHLICSHGWDHAEALPDMDAESRAAMLQRTADTIYAACGEYPAYVRPPYGTIDQETAATVNVPMMLWTVDTLDWSVLDAETVCNSIVAQAKDGGVVLCHDIYASTVEGIALALAQMMPQGWQMVTLEEYYSIFGMKPEAGHVYCGRNEAVL